MMNVGNGRMLRLGLPTFKCKVRNKNHEMLEDAANEDNTNIPMITGLWLVEDT